MASLWLEAGLGWIDREACLTQRSVQKHAAATPDRNQSSAIKTIPGKGTQNV